MALITMIDRITEGLYGAKDIALKCFDSYQSNLLQYVSYSNVQWDKENVKCGVPQ